MVDVRKAPRKGIGTCVYCGRTRKLTKDHLFPQALFITLDKEMVTVPACHQCQRRKEVGDRELEIYLTLDILGSGHADVVMHLKKIADRNEGTKHRLDRMINGADYAALTTEDGFQLAEGLVAEFDTEPVLQMLRMVARGLYWYSTGEILPPDVHTHAQRIPWNIGGELLRRLSAHRSGNPTVKGNLVVWWTDLRIQMNTPHDRLWVVCFNDAVVFLLATAGWALSLDRIRDKLDSLPPKDEGKARFSADSGLINHIEAILPRNDDGAYILPPLPQDLES